MQSSGDDNRRLRYADHVRARGDEAHADLIGAQIELAKVLPLRDCGACALDRATGCSHDRACTCPDSLAFLKRYARAALSTFLADRVGGDDTPYTPNCDWDGWAFLHNKTGYLAGLHVRYGRGFVEAFRCGAGDAFAAAVVALADEPLTGVVAEPLLYTSDHTDNAGRTIVRRVDLPPEVWDILHPPGGPVDRVAARSTHAELARAVSRAGVTWHRRRAGLAPLAGDDYSEVV